MRQAIRVLLLMLLASPALPSPPQWNGWGATDANDRFQRNGRLKAADVPRLQLKWAFGFPDAASAGAQPSIVDDRVYVGQLKWKHHVNSHRRTGRTAPVGRPRAMANCCIRVRR